MKNLIYVFAIALMGLVACGAPAEKECSAESTDTTTEKSTDTTATEEVADSNSIEVTSEEVEVENAE